jgi:hypothetical protein
MVLKNLLRLDLSFMWSWDRYRGKWSSPEKFQCRLLVSNYIEICCVVWDMKHAVGRTDIPDVTICTRLLRIKTSKFITLNYTCNKTHRTCYACYTAIALSNVLVHQYSCSKAAYRRHSEICGSLTAQSHYWYLHFNTKCVKSDGTVSAWLHNHITDIWISTLNVPSLTEQCQLDCTITLLISAFQH